MFSWDELNLLSCLRAEYNILVSNGHDIRIKSYLTGHEWIVVTSYNTSACEILHRHNSQEMDFIVREDNIRPWRQLLIISKITIPGFHKTADMNPDIQQKKGCERKAVTLVVSPPLYYSRYFFYSR